MVSKMKSALGHDKKKKHICMGWKQSMKGLDVSIACLNTWLLAWILEPNMPGKHVLERSMKIVSE